MTTIASIPSNYNQVEALLRRDIEHALDATYQHEFDSIWKTVLARGGTLRSIAENSEDPQVGAAFQQIQDHAVDASNRMAQFHFPDQCTKCQEPFYPVPQGPCQRCQNPINPTACPDCQATNDQNPTQCADCITNPTT